MTLWKPSSIPRFTYQGRRYTQVLDEYNIPIARFTDFSISNAGAPQPVIGETQIALPEGYRNRDIFKVFTTDDVRGLQEGSDKRADLILIAPFWYTVVKVHPWTYGIRSHSVIYLCNNPNIPPETEGTLDSLLNLDRVIHLDDPLGVDYPSPLGGILGLDDLITLDNPIGT